MDTLLLSWSRGTCDSVPPGDVSEILPLGATCQLLPCFLLVFNGSRRLVRRHSLVRCQRPFQSSFTCSTLKWTKKGQQPDKTALYLSWLTPLSACKPGSNSLCTRAACPFQPCHLCLLRKNEEADGQLSHCGVVFHFSLSLSKA